MLERLKYPIGKFECPDTISEDHMNNWINDIKKLPKEVIDLVNHFTEEQLETPYRNGGWTARQVIHHLHDSHHHGYIRFKWTLTEESPTIKAYYEDRWAELFDSKKAPIQLSLDLLKALHAKWAYFLEGLSFNELQKHFVHPEGNIKISLAEDIGIYAWHGKHHLAHLQIIADSKG
ncbi:putative metal-dependent hydrolase [Aquimarina sp. ERC-38]|uniref:YfiT family bacillithiol transferase n=1 Tax=Aquimarina sp. ERC-38 TaxID=2949996 RepID=UPI002245FC8A|nr:putative metal-dependent hydrolase [Aquimarina sp. ERC-38]UZO80448.1 putative metal-dependent hydrolase [Aquimarina sp. ERC-38]